MNSPNPRISVVVCTYNRCDTLKEMLDSLARMPVPQDFPWELVVVDNNSKDETRQVVESFVQSSGLNAKYALERLAGLSHARNRGIAESSAGIISFLDDDVIVDPNWLTEIWKAFERTGAMCVGGRVFLKGDPKMPSWWHESFDVAVGKFDRGDKVIAFEKGDPGLIGIGANMSFRRSVFEKYGLFDTEMGRIGNQQRTGEETELVLRLRRNNELSVYYPRAVVHHSFSSERFSKRYLRENAYHFGGWRSVSRSETPTKGAKFLGVPLWMYRAAVEAAGMTVSLTLVGRGPEAFRHERRMLVYLGYFVATLKTGRVKQTHYDLP